MLSPEKALQILYPFKVADRYTTSICQDIRHNGNTAIIEDHVCLWRGGAVGRLNNQSSLDMRGIMPRQLILQSGRNQDITWQRQQFPV